MSENLINFCKFYLNFDTNSSIYIAQVPFYLAIEQV
jgi:hypothetical protein